MSRYTQVLRVILIILVVATIAFGWISRMFTLNNWMDVVITILGLYVIVATIKMK